MNRVTALSLRSVLCATAVAVVLASNAAAASPVAAGPGGPGGDLPLTATQRHNVVAKEALARTEETRPGSVVRGANAKQPAACAQLVSASTLSPSACYTSWGYLYTYPRRQIKDYFCGVATVQVISNYSWNMGSNQDKYSQQYISDAWTRTDANGQTTAWYEAVGLQGATARSPRLPSNFTYYYKRETSGSAWNADLRIDITSFHMPMATSVAPKDPDSPYVLATWASNTIPAQYGGHWIVLNGWDGVWDGTAGPSVSFDDSGVGAYGAAGSQSAYTMWQIINKANPYHAAGYVVW